MANNRSKKGRIDSCSFKKKEIKMTVIKYLNNTIFFKGLYMLFNEREVVYIGISFDNTMQRVLDHLNDKEKIFTSFYMKRMDHVSDKQLRLIETGMINYHLPKYNKTHGYVDIKSCGLSEQDEKDLRVFESVNHIKENNQKKKKIVKTEQIKYIEPVREERFSNELTSLKLQLNK